MKKTVGCLLVLFAILLPASVFAQTDKELEQAKSWLGQWKRNFASPTYGLTLFRGQLKGGWYGPLAIPDSDREFPATAMDFRIFRGVNVSKRGGFYTGVETGVLFLAPFMDVTFEEPLLKQNGFGDMHLGYNGGLVFLMAKYGLRADLGIALFGISLGAEMGMGGTLFAGGFNFYTGSKGSPEVEEGFGSSTASLGLIMDVAGEAAIRLGKNFRLVSKLGVMAAPMSIPEQRGWEEYWYDETAGGFHPSWDPDTTITAKDNPEEFQRAVMKQYDIEIDPFALDFRVGFALNFN